MIINTEQEPTFNGAQYNGQPPMVFEGKLCLITIGSQARRIAIKGRVRAIVSCDTISEIEVFNINTIKPFVATTNRRKNASAKMCPARRAIPKSRMRGST